MTDITSALNEISGALTSLANQITSALPDEVSFAEQWGWQQPAVTRQDILDRIYRTIQTINSVDGTEVDDSIAARFAAIPRRVNFVLNNTVPNTPGGNAYLGYQTIISLLQSIEGLITPLLATEPSWQEIMDKGLLPAPLKKRLDVVGKGIGNVEKQLGSTSDKIRVISEAYQAASDLPASLSGLEDAKSRFEAAEREVQRVLDRVNKAQTLIEKTKDKIDLNLIKSIETVGQIEEVYSASTRQGLGKAFQDRSDELKFSTYALMSILFLTLAGGAWISHSRVDFIESLLSNPQLPSRVLWANVLLTAISVAAPIWFAWLLTRQIGQRFRLAEDYGFKASVAKAYEGYRREAKESGDADLQNRLLGIALDRVQEAPLSHIEQEEAGSPIHDLIKDRFSNRKRIPQNEE